MAKTDYKTIDQYHNAFSGEVVERMQTIRDIIHKAVPGVEETISYQIPCFKHHGYLIYYGAFPKHITLAHPYSAAFREHFKADLEGYKVSKAAIQIPNNKPFPEKLIKKIIEFRKKENLAAAKAKK
jgi:uncharacterized protein YdhG (YjbR/CyaY superfamily)